MDTLDDLLSKRRRGALSAAEERRLRVAVQASSEYELALLAGDAFDREGASAPGDAELVRSIALDVERRWFRRLKRGGLRKPTPLLVVVPVFLAGAAAASYGGYRALQALAAPEVAAAPVSAASAPRASGHAVASHAASGNAVATGIETSAVSASADATSSDERAADERAADERAADGPTAARARGDKALAQERAVVARPTRTPRPIAVSRARTTAHGEAASAAVLPQAASELREAASVAVLPHAASERREADAPLGPASSTPLGDGREASPPPATRLAVGSSADPDSDRGIEARSLETRSAADEASASALFRRAQKLRRRDWPAAAALYAQLISRHPGSAEAGISEMALGKWALSRDRAQEALTWFRMHQRRPSSALAAEAIWGEAQALELLGLRDRASGPWRRLIEQYPSSPYATVARQQLRHDEE